MKKFLNFLKAIYLFPFSVLMGVIASTSDAPDYTSTGDARIPALFSRIYRDKFYDAVCAANITNTKFTGELKGLGNQVTINTIPTVKIYPLVRGQKRNWQELTSAPLTSWSSGKYLGF